MGYDKSTRYSVLPVTVELPYPTPAKKLDFSLLINGNARLEPSPQARSRFSLSVMAGDASYPCYLQPPKYRNHFNLSSLPEYLPAGVYQFMAGVSGGYQLSGINLVEYFSFGHGKGSYVDLGANEYLYMDETYTMLQIFVLATPVTMRSIQL